MKIQILLLILILSISFGKKSNAIEYINFTKDGIIITGEGAVVSVTTETVKKSGPYFVQGTSEEGNIVVSTSYVVLYLQHLDLSSKTTAQFTINSKLDGIKIINKQNTTLKDYEDESTTSGECAVIKIKKKSVVSFKNQIFFTRNNVGNSLIVISAKMGMNFVCCARKELFPDEELVNEYQKIASETGATITLESDPMIATKDANVLNTDIWLSMGEPMELWEKRIKLLKKYQVNKTILDNAHKDAIFLHCLPSFHNIDITIGKEIADKFNVTEMEVSDEVFESNHSRVFEEAENRLHTIKAVML